MYRVDKDHLGARIRAGLQKRLLGPFSSNIQFNYLYATQISANEIHSPTDTADFAARFRIGPKAGAGL